VPNFAQLEPVATGRLEAGRLAVRVLEVPPRLLEVEGRGLVVAAGALVVAVGAVLVAARVLLPVDAAPPETTQLPEEVQDWPAGQ